MKLTTLILLNEFGPSMGYGSLSGGESDLIPYWDGIKEGKGWFLYRESNNWHTKRSGATIYVTEGEPHKHWIKVKTHGLKKSNDTYESLRERVKKHTDKVARAWVTAAKRLHDEPELNEVGNPMHKPWSQCFKEALSDPKVSPYLSEHGEEKISPVADPVNFTPRLEENTTHIPKIVYWVRFWHDQNGVHEDALQDFETNGAANKFIFELRKKKMTYECLVQLPPDEGLHDSKTQKGWHHMTRDFVNGDVFERFKE